MQKSGKISQNTISREPLIVQCSFCAQIIQNILFPIGVSYNSYGLNECFWLNQTKCAKSAKILYLDNHLSYNAIFALQLFRIYSDVLNNRYPPYPHPIPSTTVLKIMVAPSPSIILQMG